ncbi:MAG TPA: hypothetical protein V6D17_10940 [Candidatus Obscuribacterales bacterium]
MYGQHHYQNAAEQTHFAVGDMGLKLIFGCILFLGIIAYVTYLTDNQDIAKSAAWPTVDGTLNEIGDSGTRMPIIGRYMPISQPYAKYAYTVDGKVYTGAQYAGPSLSYIRMFSWHPPEIDLPDTDEILEQLKKDQARGTLPADYGARLQRSMELTEEMLEHPKYKPIKVRYDAKNPENSVLDPGVLQSDKSQLYTSICLVLVGGLLLGGSILHGYLSAPVPDDPSLSLEAALAAQKRRRY